MRRRSFLGLLVGLVAAPLGGFAARSRRLEGQSFETLTAADLQTPGRVIPVPREWIRYADLRTAMPEVVRFHKSDAQIRVVVR